MHLQFELAEAAVPLLGKELSVSEVPGAAQTHADVAGARALCDLRAVAAGELSGRLGVFGRQGWMMSSDACRKVYACCTPDVSPPSPCPYAHLLHKFRNHHLRPQLFEGSRREQKSY